MVYEVNLGVREYIEYTDAMLNNSLFSYFLQKNGLDVYKGESTRDLICLRFDYGSRSYEDEKYRLLKLKEEAEDIESKNKIDTVLERISKNVDSYHKISKEKLREKYYQDDVSIVYHTKNKDGSIKSSQTIQYRMLYRTSAKAKLGEVIFINVKLYEKAYDWLTMGLGNKMPHDNAKIVELSAYAPLTTSTIVGTLNIPVEDILILKDQDSFFKTMVNVVKAEKYAVNLSDVEKKRCVVSQEEREVKNTLWDGLGIFESNILPSWVNGMALIRNHFFKMCGFRGRIQKFFVDWCYENGHDYYTYQIPDMFGNMHYLKDIKVITTDNSIKWKKFIDLMGGTPQAAYKYWCDRIKEDGNIWGIVKTDHLSKLGNLQQMSYQMINTLPCTKDEVKDIAQISIDYVEKIKQDNNEFEKFLRKNANEVNHYEMMADLYARNHDFAESTWFRTEKRNIISAYVHRLRNGKITINGDNLTMCGNPYALLLYSVGEDWKSDPCFNTENGVIQCYTSRFKPDEYLCAIRSPHNSPNNMCYLHNVYSEEIEKYFNFSDNIIAVNCIETDIQDRLNGADFDSDFIFVTNDPTMIKCAKRCYENFPTIVNALKESGITYQNTKLAYAQMDNKFSKSRLGIGWSSNLAQLALTYYWTELHKENPDAVLLKNYYDNFVILSVLAQVIIDGCKREYEIDGMEEIIRIQRMPCMDRTKEVVDEKGKTKKIRFDYPLFMKYTKEIKTTKSGKEIPEKKVETSREKLKRRIDPSLICPMNWLQECLDKIQNTPSINTIPINKYFIKMNGDGNRRQMSKIRQIIEEFDNFIIDNKTNHENDEFYNDLLIEKSKNIVLELRKIKIRNIITINRLIETSLELEKNHNKSSVGYPKAKRYQRKMLNYLYKMNKEKFLQNFICK